MRWGIAGFAGLMLAGCGPEADERTARTLAKHSIDPATGETVMTIPHKGAAATLRAGPKVPVTLPAGFTLFPGTRVANSAHFSRPDAQGSLVTFSAEAPAADVVAHYRGEAAAAGFAIELEHDAAGSLLLIGARARDGARLAVTATGGTPTTGQLVLSTLPPR